MKRYYFEVWCNGSTSDFGSLSLRSNRSISTNFFKNNIKMFNFLKTYNQVKQVFVKPNVKISLKPWCKSSGLPVWRNGPSIKLYSLFKNPLDNLDWSKCAFYENNPSWNESFKKKYPIISKLFKPSYNLPIWLSFHIYDFDVIWKEKYNEIRFEFPPQFTFVFFGLAFTILLYPPIEDFVDGYWEGILNYLYNNKSLKKAIKETNFYTNKENKYYWCIRPEFIRKEHIDTYYAAISELNNERIKNGDSKKIL